MAENTSLVLMLVSILLSISLIIFSSRHPKRIYAAAIAGALVGVANIGVEFIGARSQIYFVYGLWPFARSAFSLSLAWALFAMSLTLGSELTRKSRRSVMILIIYLISGIGLGFLSDYLGQIWLGHFKMGPRGNWALIFCIWFTLVPTGILIYKLILKIEG
jgi:hypothetical protein